jgi:hypothetical protein
MNKLALRARETIPFNEIKIKTITNKIIEDKKNNNEKFNLKINKNTKQDLLELNIENVGKIRPKTFENQKKISNNAENKSIVNKNKFNSHKRINKSKAINSDLEKINNLMKFKKRTNANAFEDLIPFNDIRLLSNNDMEIEINRKNIYENNYNNINNNNSKNKISLNNIDKSSLFLNILEIQTKRKVNC